MTRLFNVKNEGKVEAAPVPVRGPLPSMDRLSCKTEWSPFLMIWGEREVGAESLANRRPVTTQPRCGGLSSRHACPQGDALVHSKEQREVTGVFPLWLPLCLLSDAFLGKEMGPTPSFSPSSPRLHGEGTSVLASEGGSPCARAPARWPGTRRMVGSRGREGSLLSGLCCWCLTASPA